MDWQLIKRPMVAAAYAVNVAVRARRGIRGRSWHKGSAREIVRACIDDCWDGAHYRASPGYFRQFWTRDLSFSTPSLARLSPQHRERAIQSFDWAIRTWERRKSHITTTIHFFDQPVDVFDYGVDCLPLLMAALVRIDADGLLGEHRPWLEGEVRHYLDEVVDPGTGMVRADRKYSAHRDTVVNRCNAFGNSMVALLAMTLMDLGWDVPDRDSAVGAGTAGHPDGSLLGSARILRRYAWGRPTVRRRQRLAVLERRHHRPISPATGPRHARSAAATRTRTRSSTSRPATPRSSRWFVRTFMPDYQGSTVWTSLGSMYLQLLHSIEPQRARPEIDRYISWIERDGTFWEVIDDETGLRYSSTFLHPFGREHALVRDLPGPARTPCPPAVHDASNRRSTRQHVIMMSLSREWLLRSEGESGMNQPTGEATIRFRAALSTIETSTVLRLPEAASTKLPSRGAGRRPRNNRWRQVPDGSRTRRQCRPLDEGRLGTPTESWRQRG